MPLTERYNRNGVRLIEGDSRDAVRALAGEYTCVITDPPWDRCPDTIKGHEDPWQLARDVFEGIDPAVDRLAVIVGQLTDPRWMTCVPERFPYLMPVYLRYQCPSPIGVTMLGGNFAHLFGRWRRKDGKRVLSCELEAVNQRRNGVRHPMLLNRRAIRSLIGMVTSAEDCILDPFTGSGTIPVQAAKLGRKAIGIDVDPDHVREACERMGVEANCIQLTGGEVAA